MVVNHTNLSIVDEFAIETYNRILEVCNEFESFDIHVYLIYDYKELFKDEKLLREQKWNSPLTCYIQSKTGYLRDMVAAIGIDKNLCDGFGFNEDDYKAALAHEIGHMVSLFQNMYDREDKGVNEVVADFIAYKLGYGDSLKTCLEKIIMSECDGLKKELTKRRIECLEHVRNK